MYKECETDYCETIATTEVQGVHRMIAMCLTCSLAYEWGAVGNTSLHPNLTLREVNYETKR